MGAWAALEHTACLSGSPRFGQEDTGASWESEKQGVTAELWRHWH